MSEPAVGVDCGHCGGPVHMETCEQNGGPRGHVWVVASECQRCGVRYNTLSGCLDCVAGATAAST